ncbi:hypothetical protein CGZ80_09975 [Rhodopirellula sp. MGV]|nr:hypothetical protein CGZ80_09975 [Rhodopirellula sp. MGV]
MIRIAAPTNSAAAGLTPEESTTVDRGGNPEIAATEMSTAEDARKRRGFCGCQAQRFPASSAVQQVHLILQAVPNPILLESVCPLTLGCWLWCQYGGGSQID